MRPTDQFRIFVGFDADEIEACAIAIESFRRHATRKHRIDRLSRLTLWKHYQRPTERRNGRLWDVISNAPMSTDHALARFFIPFICDYQGWALFTDGDVLCRRDVTDLFALADDRYALMCVQHPPLLDTDPKKDGAVQQPYPRKNWSSVMLFNCAHPANRPLDLDVLNHAGGLMLHAFNWLRDEEIGALPAEWNYLVGVNPYCETPALVHYTLGLPRLSAFAGDLPFAHEWYAIAQQLGYQLTAVAI